MAIFCERGFRDVRDNIIRTIVLTIEQFGAEELDVDTAEEVIERLKRDNAVQLAFDEAHDAATGAAEDWANRQLENYAPECYAHDRGDALEALEREGYIVFESEDEIPTAPIVPCPACGHATSTAAETGRREPGSLLCGGCRREFRLEQVGG